VVLPQLTWCGSRSAIRLPNLVIHPPADVLHQELAVGFGQGEIQNCYHVLNCAWVELAVDVELIDDAGDGELVIVSRSHRWKRPPMPSRIVQGKSEEMLKAKDPLRHYVNLLGLANLGIRRCISQRR
jgi:hypothetical protein